MATASIPPRTGGRLLDGARELLMEAGFPCRRAISVDRDSILFLGVRAQPMTGWIHRYPSGKVLVYVRRGFEAEEPAGLHDPLSPPV